VLLQAMHGINACTMHGINACSPTNSQKGKESVLLQALLHEEGLMEVCRHAIDATGHPGFFVFMQFPAGSYQVLLHSQRIYITLGEPV
jgi:hypothetical protein